MVASKTTIDQDWLNVNIKPELKEALQLQNTIPSFDHYLQKYGNDAYHFAEYQSDIITKDL